MTGCILSLPLMAVTDKYICIISNNAALMTKKAFTENCSGVRYFLARLQLVRVFLRTSRSLQNLLFPRLKFIRQKFSKRKKAHP